MSCYIEACGLGAFRRVGSLGAGSACGNRPKSGSTRVGNHRGEGPARTATARTRNDLRPGGCGRFGVPIDSVNIVHGDTDKVQMGMGTYGSRSGAVGMSAVFKALDKVEAKAKRIAAHLMEADESDIVIEDGALQGGRHRQVGPLVAGGACCLYRA